MCTDECFRGPQFVGDCIRKATYTHPAHAGEESAPAFYSDNCTHLSSGGGHDRLDHSRVLARRPCAATQFTPAASTGIAIASHLKTLPRQTVALQDQYPNRSSLGLRGLVWEVLLNLHK